MDGVADGGGWGGEGVLASMVYEWGNEGRGVGGTMSLGRACLKCGESYKLSPHLKFWTSRRERLLPRKGCFGAHGV